MSGESIQVTRSVSIPRSEIELRFSRSSGPGGQHAQKSDTRVEASFDVEASPALTEAQKRRVLAQGRPGPAGGRPGRAQPVAQPRARDRAPGRGAAGGAARPAEAPADEAEQAAVERRLEQKRRRSEVKRRRRGLD